MAQELLAFRLFAPYFGYSIYVWGSMISVVMVALALGYAAGGWVSDRSRTDFPLYGLLLASATYQLAVLFTVRSVLRYSSHHGDFAGVALASLFIFGPPMTAMATACPFLIRLLAHSGRVGSVSGTIYAISTIGSIAGILLTSFFLIPHFGTQKTLTLICITSALIAVVGLAPRAPFALFALGLILAISQFVPATVWPQSTLWVAESPYNLVRVIRNGAWLVLKLNGGGGVHTIRDERGRWTRHYYDYFALGPVLTPARRLLVLGLGGGASIAATRMTAPDIAIDAVEIDPKVVEAATRFFGLNPEDGKLRIHIADARPWLAAHTEHYDLVHVDLYQGGPFIPFYLITVEFFEAVRDHMSPEGLLMMNVFDVSPKHELLVPTLATLKRVFPTAVVLSGGYGNRMFLAFAKGTSDASIRARLSKLTGTEAIKRLAGRAAAQIVNYDVASDTPVFTDDLAPVEEITRRMLNHAATSQPQDHSPRAAPTTASSED